MFTTSNHHHLFALRIERARRLIEQQYLRIPHQRPSDGDALLLPARQLRALLTNSSGVALPNITP